MCRTIITLVAVVSLCFAVTAAQAGKKKKPDATLELEGGSVAVGIGFSWSGGTLTYKGKKYDVKVDGLSVGDVGITKSTLKGSVYNLKKLSDFDGNYSAVGAGATVGGGGSATTMKNQNGVTINLVSTTQGARLTLGAAGVNMQIKQ
jgi:hypothetical protein